MGWISDKFQREGRAKWGKPISADKRRAPLRRIVEIRHHSDDIFSPSSVTLECGHQVLGVGSAKSALHEVSP